MLKHSIACVCVCVCVCVNIHKSMLSTVSVKRVFMYIMVLYRMSKRTFHWNICWIFYVSDKPGGNILRAKDSKVVLCCTVLQNAVLYPPLTRNIHRNTHWSQGLVSEDRLFNRSTHALGCSLNRLRAGEGAVRGVGGRGRVVERTCAVWNWHDVKKYS